MFDGGGIRKIIEGAGHLWFLPMLFWCFIFTYLVETLNVNPAVKMLVIITCVIFIIMPDYIRISRSFKYLPFFYGGYLSRQKITIIKEHINYKSISLIWLCFITSFILLYYVRDNYLSNVKSLSSTLYIYLDTICQFIYASIGTMAFFITAYAISEKVQINEKMIEMGKYCFGVYIWQQFILYYLYYKTSFVSQVPDIIIPWLGMIFALILSYSLSRVTKVL